MAMGALDETTVRLIPDKLFMNQKVNMPIFRVTDCLEITTALWVKSAKIWQNETSAFHQINSLLSICCAFESVTSIFLRTKRLDDIGAENLTKTSANVKQALLSNNLP